MNENLPPDVRRDLHSDAVRVNRQQLWFALLGIVLVAIAVPISFLIRPYWMWRTFFAAGMMLVWVGRTVLEWRRLRRIDPSQYDE